MFFHCIWCESVNRTHSTMWLSDFGTSVFPFHPFPCQWLKLLIVVHPLGFLEREFRRHSQVQQWFGQQLSSVVIDRSIDVSLQVSWKDLVILTTVCLLTDQILESSEKCGSWKLCSAKWETQHFRREDKRQAIRIPNVPQSNEVWITMKIINV